MKKIYTILTALVLTMTAVAQTLNVEVGDVTYQFSAAQAGEMTFAEGTSLTILNKVFQLSEVTRMYTDASEVVDNTVIVSYDGTSARVLVAGNVAQYVAATVSGAHVSIVQSADVNEEVGEISYSLAGTSADGEFYMEGSYKATLDLRGLTLTNPTGAAINIQNGKRIDVSAKLGTVNTITDGTGGTQKGAFVCKGHTEFKGKGELNIYGRTAHAVWSKEYVELKNCTLNILSAVGDGINCNQYFLMESGTLTIKGVGDDGIQVSYKDDEAEREDDDSSEATILGGTLSITTTANGAKAIKAESDITMMGGSLTITQSGKPTTDGTDYSYVSAVKADRDINILGGMVTINNAAMGGRGLSADGTVTIDQVYPTITTDVNITVSGNGGTDAEMVEDGGSSSGSEAASYKVYVSVPTSGGGPGGGGPGGGGGGNSAWSAVYLYKSDGTLVSQLTSTVTLTSGNTSRTFYVYDFKSAQTGNYYFKGNDYTSGGGWGGGTTYAIQSSTFAAPTSGSDVYYTMSGYSTSGSTRTYTLTNATSTWSGASGSSSDDNYTAKGIKADEKVALNAGTITIKATGTGGKGIKSSGSYTQGLSGGTGPTLKVTTSGSSIGGNSGGGGGFPGGGGMESSGGSSSKAIKVMGIATLYGGTSEIYTSTDGAEGLESKTAIYIEGGQHYFKCYDDCINSKGKIFFNGGVTVCYGYGNDSVDSNAGTTGAITIGNGAVFAYTTKGSPEEGFDCDNNSYIQITGTGIAISAGAAQGGGSSSSTISGAAQGYAFVSSSISYKSNTYYTLSDASGNNLATYSFEGSCSSSLALFTATGMVKNSTYYIKSSTSAPTDATTAWHGFYLGSTAKGTTSVTSFTAK